MPSGTPATPSLRTELSGSAHGVTEYTERLARLEWDELREVARRGDGTAGEGFLTLIFLGLIDSSGLDTLEAVLDATSSVPLDPYGRLLRKGCRALVRAEPEAAVAVAVEALAVEPHPNLWSLVVGRAQLSMGNYGEAFENLFRASQAIAADSLLRVTALRCLENVVARSYDETLARGVLEHLRDERLDGASVSRLACSLIRLKYDLGAEIPPDLHLETVASDPLVIECLERSPLSDPDVELWLLRVRESVLRCSLQAARIPPGLGPLVRALVLQSVQNENVFSIRPEEQLLLGQLQEELRKALPLAPPGDSSLVGALLLFSMYVSPWSSDLREALLARPLEAWPEPARPLVDALIHLRAREAKAATRVEALTPVGDEVSLRVRAMYEENPYPRWTSVSHIPSAETYLERFARRWPQHPLPRVGPRPEMLVAGGGTGRHPIGLSLAHCELDITAIDLSRASLGYAQMKAEELGVANLRFYQGDLLELRNWQGRFPLVECAGVLHHMASASEGLGVLRSLLCEHGILKLGLYSRRARAEIRAFRDRRSTEEASLDEIRAARRALLEAEGERPDYLGAPDFYRTSSCRDLLFHVHEQPLALGEILEMLESHRLRMCGFEFPSSDVPRSFALRFPDRSLDDMVAWELFEAENPTTFSAMYVFYAQAC